MIIVLGLFIVFLILYLISLVASIQRDLKISKGNYRTQELLETGDQILVECNPKDSIWGIGLSVDNPDALDESKWKGQNLLGKILMQIREELRQTYDT